jgi:hypothetical protein
MACPNKKLVKSYLTPDEYEALADMARRAGVSISRLVRTLCCTGQVKTFEHEEFKLELIKARGEIGRLGGLFRLALGQLPDGDMDKSQLRRVLREIEQRQREIKALIGHI